MLLFNIKQLYLTGVNGKMVNTGRENEDETVYTVKMWTISFSYLKEVLGQKSLRNL